MTFSRSFLIAIAMVTAFACTDTPFSPANLAEMTIRPQPVLLTSIGDTARLTAVALDASGRTISSSAIWRTDNADVISITQDGLVIARMQGSAHVIADVEGITDSVAVTVRQRVASISNGGQSSLLRPGDTLRVHFAAADARGNAVSNVRYQWEVSQAPSISIDSLGLARVQDVGYYWARGRVDGVSATYYFSVTENFDTISAGGRASCARTTGGEVYCWGHGFTTIMEEPRYLSSVYGNPAHIRSAAGELRFLQIAAGDVHACGIAVDRAVYCWGDGRFTGTGAGGVEARRVGNGSFIAVAANVTHTCGVTVEGNAYCWGDVDSGQLGAADATPGVPTRVSTGLRFTTIAAGGSHTCALTATGEAWCWGSNDAGQLGIGEIDDASHSVPVKAGTDLRFTQISAGGRHTCAVTDGGRLYCWGANQWGQTGIGAFTAPCTSGGLPSDCVLSPAAVALTNVTQVSAGAQHTCAVAGGDGFCWGNARNGRTGNRVSNFTASPVILPYGWTMISAGGMHSCGFDAQVGGLNCFGSNSWGQMPRLDIGGESFDPGGTGFHR